MIMEFMKEAIYVGMMNVGINAIIPIKDEIMRVIVVGTMSHIIVECVLMNNYCKEREKLTKCEEKVPKKV